MRLNPPVKIVTILFGVLISFEMALVIIPTIRANPVVSPTTYYHNTVVPPIFNLTAEVELTTAQVTLDIHEDYTNGTGNYIITNLENDSVFIFVYFDGFDRDTSITRFSTNSSSNLLPIGVYEGITYEYYEISFQPNQTREIIVEWAFQSRLYYTSEVKGFYPAKESHTVYHTGYSINAGSCWGQHNISEEKIRFNFHTDEYFENPDEISVAILEEEECFEAREGDIVSRDDISVGASARNCARDSNANQMPFWEFTAQNISKSMTLHIIRDKSVTTIDIPFLAGILFAVGLVALLPLALLRGNSLRWKIPLTFLPILGVVYLLRVFSFVPSNITLLIAFSILWGFAGLCFIGNTWNKKGNPHPPISP